MLTDFEQIIRHIPNGIVVTDQNLSVVFVNDHTKISIFGIDKNDKLENLGNIIFYTTELTAFDMESCMRNMIGMGKRIFQKTLIYRTDKVEKLIFFSVRSIGVNGENTLFLFSISDITNEMDCISQTREDFSGDMPVLRKKIIGNDPKLLEIFRMITLAAKSDVNIMIQGESGTGKELVADAIHNLSDRKKHPFIKINCAAFPESLLESELFGHKKGAFTGAYTDKPGKFELANNGTIFLDEIGEISQAIQVKLLRVIQEKTIERLGDTVSKKLNIRIVAATNKDLKILVQKNIFREDLYYRLNVFSINMPALRERHLDIPILTDHFIRKFNQSMGKNIKALNKPALKKLMEYAWPGNIRQLQNAIEHAFVLAEGAIIQVDDLPKEITQSTEPVTKHFIHRSDNISETPSPLQSTNLKARKGKRLNISKDDLLKILEINEFNQKKTAEYMGISRVALWKKMKKHNI